MEANESAADMFTVMHLESNLVLLGLPTLKQFSALVFFLILCEVVNNTIIS